MNTTPLVTVYTQVYNTKESDLRTCIESVLNQTYENIEYFILDNASTDGSSAILDEYAKRDNRIHLFRFEKNVLGLRYIEISNSAKGYFWTTVDSDDWIDASYIENLVFLALSNDLDIAVCGSLFHSEGGFTSARAVPHNLIINASQYSSYFCNYHVFFRTMWGKLIRSSIVNQNYHFKHNIIYGKDTVLAFNWLRHSKRIGIFSKILHHYRCHTSSVSYQYDPLRFASDIALFQDALDFLKPYGPISITNLTFLYIVYCNAVTDTLNVIENSKLSPQEKLEEYKKIALEPTTQGAYQVNDDSATNSKSFLFLYMLKNASLAENGQDCLQSLAFYLPHCSEALVAADADLFAQNQSLFETLLKDDCQLLREALLQGFKKSPYRTQEKIVNLLSALTDELPICQTATTHRFISHFPKVYTLLLHSEHLQALEEMTDLLLNHRVKDAQEVFFQVYLTLSALLQQEPAYLFGKIQWAEYLFSDKRYEESAQVVEELEKMGLSEHEEVVKLKKKLARYLSEEKK